MAAHVFRALSLFSLVLAVGCSKTASQAVEKPRAVEEKSTPQAPVTEDDFKILDVVLVDLLDY
jgi:Na+-transporting methylmalonyl-CoA/oxaloacetate decarboxylase gamma subunit